MHLNSSLIKSLVHPLPRLPSIWCSYIIMLKRTVLLVAGLLTIAVVGAYGSFNYLIQGYIGEGSHFLSSAYLAEGLIRRGHNVTFLISSVSSYRKSDPKWGSMFDFIEYKNPHHDNAFRRTTDEFVKRSFEYGLTTAMLHHSVVVFDTMVEDCHSILSDDALQQTLATRQFDMLVYDGGWLCSPIIAEKLNLKRVLLNPSGYNPGVAGLGGSSSNMAYISPQLEGQSSPPLSFYERLHGLASNMYAQISLGSALIPPYVSMQKKYNISKDLGIGEVMSHNLDLVLINMDAEIEQLVPLTAKVITVGGLTAGPPLPLPQDLKNFMQDSGGLGVVLFSLGSYVDLLPAWLVDELIRAFSMIPYKVLWKFNNKNNLYLPANVKALEWLPQNDALGHRRTKLFVFHGGNNGFYEAVYHGVPMVVLPVMGDQAQVATRAKNRGIGVSLDIRSLKAEDLRNAIMNVMTNKSIRENMRRVRDMFHHKQMNVTEKAAYWIEHVTRFGGDPYRPNVFHLNVFQMSLLDVRFVLLLLTISAFYIIYLIFWLMCNITLKLFKQVPFLLGLR